MARLFIAVWPPEELVVQLMALHRKDQRGVRFLPPENWHITLRFLGDSDADEVRQALDDTELPPARARVGPGVDVLRERTLIVPVDGLDALALAVTRATTHIGERPRPRFTGHLTVARVKRHVPMPRALGARIGVEFDVEEVALVQSRLGPGGARYETVETWRLGDQPSPPTRRATRTTSGRHAAAPEPNEPGQVFRRSQRGKTPG